MVVVPTTPELFEDDLLAVVDARTDALQTLRELGPPDLVHLIKTPIKGAPKQLGVYHHVTGVDASSSAALAAYINTLTYAPYDKQNKVVSGLYCCYNAFSRLDMRVQVAIPGTVESYCIDERGDKRETTDDLWLETFLCAILRAFSYADDGSGETIKKIVGVRRFNPIVNTEAEHRFFDAAERLFFSGWQLGSDPEIQVPTLVSNHLTNGLLHYINTTGRYTSGINLFEKLKSKDPEIASILARVYIAADEEVKAVQLLHEAIEELPMDYSLLDSQAEFLNNKGRPDLALDAAKRAVIAAPSEFGTWARLAEIYVNLEQWDLALLTLNSCPMFTYQDKDAPRGPEPLRVYLPTLAESICDEIDDQQATPEIEHVHSSLRKLHAAGFKGTFMKGYALLTEITKKIGWDQLLKIRSQVFVMEEEYRNEKETISHSMHNRNPSTVALRGASPDPQAHSAKLNGHPEVDEEDSPSTDKDNDHDEKDDGDDDEDEEADEEDSEATPTKETDSSDTEAAPKSNGALSSTAADAIPNPKPTSTSTGTDANPANPANPTDPAEPTEPTEPITPQPRLQNKRLCERWLDNLIMVLYEDLRVYTIWRSEMAQLRQQQLPYKKSAEEWEILGDLAGRLHHADEAIEAYQACLQIRFSPKALRGILVWLERVGDTKRVVGAVIRLICWQYRWYSEFSPYLMRSIRKLIEDEGMMKISSLIQATPLPGPVLGLTSQYISICGAFDPRFAIEYGSRGSD